MRPMTCNCNYTAIADHRLNVRKHQGLHSEGRKLIESWFVRAWGQRCDANAVFESFIFAWFSVNAWAACVTGKDADWEYIRRLQGSFELAQRFERLMSEDPEFSDAATRFHAYWPIFKAQRLRRHGISASDIRNRAERVQHYLNEGIRDYEPSCWQAHHEAGEAVPLDWPHTLAAIYRVRCNLFHGEKSAHSEMDRKIVESAFSTLVLFFRRSGIL